MKAHKFFLFLVSAVLTAALFTGCSSSANPSDGGDGTTQQGDQNVSDTTDNGQTNNDNNQNNENNEIQLIDYNFVLSCFPYDSEGLTVKVDAEITDKNYYSKQEIGIVPAVTIDASLSKTLKFPDKYDYMYILFYDNKGVLKYSKPVSKQGSYDEEKDIYDIAGYYYYNYDVPDPTKPYAAGSINELKNLEYNKEYELDGKKNPYLIFHATDVRDKFIKITKKEVSNAELLVATTEEAIMTYKSQELTQDVYECKANDVYFMVKSISYDYKNAGTAKCIVSFSDITADIKNSLEIDKSILASNGMIYASGTNSQEHSKGFLWKIDPATGTKTQIKNFYSDIISIKELEPGTLYVSYDTCISMVNLETEAVSSLVSDLPNKPEAFVNYKDNKLVITGHKPTSSAGERVLLDKTTGKWKIVDYYHYYISHGDVDVADELFYFSDYNLFISNTSNRTPYDISFMKLASDDMDAPKYYSYDTQYHGDYEMKGPIKIISESPLQVLTSGGCVFTIDTDLLESVSYTEYDSYYSKIKAWAKYESTAYRAYDDCIFSDEFVYYMTTNKNENNCTVLKCSLDAKKEVLNEQVYNKERGVNFYSLDNKIYLLTNGTEVIYNVDSYKDYKVFLHEIDF